MTKPPTDGAVPVECERCSDCPPVGYPTDKTRCEGCDRSTIPTASSEATTWSTATVEQRERVTLLADVELHLQSVRVFITSREKMHPCGVELHDELLAKVSAAIDVIGREKNNA